MKSSLFRSLAAGTALALVFGLPAAATAAPSDAAPAAKTTVHDHGPKGDARMARGQHHDGLFIPGLGPLPKSELDALKLTADQQKQVDTLKAAQRESHKEMRAERTAHYAMLKQQLDSGRLDPRALAKQADAKREARHKAAEASETQALAIWDSLSDVQKTQVTAFVKARHDRMAERRAEHEGKREGKRQVAPAAS
ncbi:MAG: hypothetical protein JHC61_16100 [Burkholderiaceae bacterium]|nr:hypothetical protein [Burkholderiaceae bacterium]